MKALLIGAPITIVAVVMAFAFIPGFSYDINSISVTNTPVHSDTATIIDTSNYDKLGGDKVMLVGYAHVVHRAADGSIISENTYKNRFVDTGEDFLLDQGFQDTVSTADNGSIGSICIGDQGTVTVDETETASDFDTDNGITENNCKEDTTVTTSGGTAVIGPITFTCGGTNCADGDTITGIAICQNDVTDDGDFNNCATEGIMFSVIDITDATVNTGETLDIDYTFDITSPSN